MVALSRFLSDHLLTLQLSGIAIGSTALWLAPPAQGAMLLVPVTPASGHGLIARAIDGGARLIDTGPVPGSIIVSGDRSALSPHLPQGVLLLAAPRTGCAA